MLTVSFIDYGAGSLRSVWTGLERIGAKISTRNTDYGVPVPSRVAKHNLLATQFLPEKSRKNSSAIFKTFIKIAKR